MGITSSAVVGAASSATPAGALGGSVLTPVKFPFSSSAWKYQKRKPRSESHLSRKVSFTQCAMSQLVSILKHRKPRSGSHLSRKVSFTQCAMSQLVSILKHRNIRSESH